jgi:UDP-N-acetylmuramoyl-L-alanyl-D-glutamate--2,6-diaminopimelate ligase
MEDYFDAKKRLFAISREAVVNADDRWGRRLLSEPLSIHHYHICHADGAKSLLSDRICPAGEGGCTRLYAEQVKFLGEDGVAFKLTSPDVRLRLRCPVPGQFTVMNALEAASAALALGADPSAVRDALAHFGGVPGRMERVVLPETDVPFSVYVDFAHTPDALENLLRSVHGFRRQGQRIVLVFGCGGDRDSSKRKVMARVASRMADSLVITSDNSRSENPADIISDILLGVDKESEFAVVPNRAEAIRYAVRHARGGDIILLAGKGHETYEIDRRGKHPFCEKDIVVEAAQEFHTPYNG